MNLKKKDKSPCCDEELEPEKLEKMEVENAAEESHKKQPYVDLVSRPLLEGQAETIIVMVVREVEIEKEGARVGRGRD